MKRTLLLALLAWACPALAAPPAIPQPLEPWREWVLDAHPTLGCPATWAGLDQPVCAWPGRLELRADDKGARFSQRWSVYREDWVQLPGDARYWPQQLRVNGQPQPLVEREGRPALRLPPGEAQVEGEFSWERIPQVLPLPAFTGLVGLELNGVLQPRAVFTADGALLLAPSPARGAAPVESDSATIRVHRRLEDGVPMLLETRIALRIAGGDRELLTGRALPEGAVLSSMYSELPARIESDGRLRVQARAGEWEIVLAARIGGDQRAFRTQRLDQAWPAQEIWSLEADPAQRGLKLGGATPVDPSQVDLPGEWQKLPAWLLDESSTLELEQLYRGDTRPRADELTLQRMLWLDFDGRGFTARDHLQGTLHRAWRLRADPRSALGRASIHGEPQLITRAPGESADGIELRERNLDLEAVSRFERAAQMSAIGWQHGMNRVQATLQLPPGWRLWHASGVDRVNGSWLARWDLWDTFVVLIAVVATLRLLGARSAALAAPVFALGFHEAAWLLWLWLGLLLAGALRALVLRRAWAPAIRLLHGLVALALVLALLDRAVQLARETLYPQLELAGPVGRGAAQFDSYTVGAAMSMPAPASPPDEGVLPEMADRAMSKRAPDQLEEIIVSAQKSKPAYDIRAQIQTGPGVPDWSWRRIELRWSGPVTPEQQLRLLLSPPALTRAVDLAQILLWAGLLMGLMPRLRQQWRGALAPALLLALIGATLAPPVRAADFPDRALLQELEQRLLRAPPCAPACASIASARLEIDAGTLQLRLRIDTQTDVYVPLPASHEGWQPQRVLLDGAETTALAHVGGRLQLALASGRHEVMLSGPALADHIDLPFDLPVHTLTVAASGWQVGGVQDGHVPGGVLQLQRLEREQREERVLQPDPVAPFVRIERALLFGNEWGVRTTVSRIAPASGAINIEVPLLAGEAVTGSAFRVVDGRVRAVLAPDEQEVQWSAQLAQVPELVLESAAQAGYVERWRLLPGPQWHLEWQDLAPVKDEGLLFLPWPGERMRVAITRPAPVTGPAQTVEALHLASTPGARVAEHVLELDLRASQAGEYRLQLPEGAMVQSLQADGEALDTEDTRDVVLPVHPGEQKFALSWREEQPLGMRWRMPAVALSTPATNLAWRINVPNDRWLLWAGGPPLGPALLYWGVLLVIIAVALLLGRAARWWPHAPPLSSAEWVLLGIGMSTANQIGSVLVVAWLFALAWRGARRAEPSRRMFNLVQVLLLMLSVAALLTLLGTIPESLLSTPDMQVTGNGSWSGSLEWYQDRSEQQLARPAIVSLPLWSYRIAMLAWSLWLAWKLLDWLRWGWRCLVAGGGWRAATPAPRASAEGTA